MRVKLPRYTTRDYGVLALSLIHIYPDFPKFRQPLSGMIAGKKSLLAQCEFEEGYGVAVSYTHLDVYKRQPLCRTRYFR